MPRGIKTTEPNIKTICQVCHKEFLAYAKTEKYCCKQCAKIAAREQIQESKRLRSIEQYKDTPGIAICKECGFRGHDLYTHIRFAHNLTAKEYCEKYNCTPDDLLSEQTHINRSKAQKNSVNPNKRRFKSGSENPAFNHGGKLSPFSKNFEKYNNLSEEEKDAKILELARKANDNKMEAGNCVFTKEYYMTHFNMSEDEAEKALSERQSTFSLEKCIEKYGDEEGRKRWKERQEKWQKTLMSKPIEEIHRINASKVWKSPAYSKVSQEFAKKLAEQLKTKQEYLELNIKYATLDNKGLGEQCVRSLDNKRLYKIDFSIPDLKIGIEFNGDYWYNRPEVSAKDIVKLKDLSDLGWKILTIWEHEWNKNPNEVLLKCEKFIEDNK